MTAQAQAAFECPKCGARMKETGRRAGLLRCTQCGGVFVDTETMRRGRGGMPPIWLPVMASLFGAVVVSRVRRRLGRRGGD